MTSSLMPGRTLAEYTSSAKLTASAVATATWPEGKWNTVDAGARRATSGLSSFSAAKVIVGAVNDKMTAFHRRRATHAKAAVARIPPIVSAFSPIDIAVASRNCRSPLWAPSSPRTHASTQGSRFECHTSPLSTAVTTMAAVVTIGAHDGASDAKPFCGRAARRPPST
jgi:hypothetical protein